MKRWFSVLTALCCCTAPAAYASVVSISFDLQQTFVEDANGNAIFGGVNSTVPVGEPSNNVGLQLPGQVGAWHSLVVGNGFLTAQFSQPASITADGLTFTFNTNARNEGPINGLVGDYETFATGTGDNLRDNVVFQRLGNINHTPRQWEITGLDPSLTYNIILFGQSGPANPALFSIDGHDAGNGVGKAVTLDAENDGNFLNVAPDANGVITGVFDTPAGVDFSAWSGLQIQAVPEPGSLALLTAGGLFLLRRRR